MIKKIKQIIKKHTQPTQKPQPLNGYPIPHFDPLEFFMGEQHKTITTKKTTNETLYHLNNAYILLIDNYLKNEQTQTPQDKQLLDNIHQKITQLYQQENLKNAPNYIHTQKPGIYKNTDPTDNNQYYYTLNPTK